jgi:hypothetical protein
VCSSDLAPALITDRDNRPMQRVPNSKQLGF